ncbi:MAG: sigma-54-dependent Fis family transcriptional regulator [Phycisphaeraceae bacterium]|nr:MAG: sigma-54-dependent Fis family transcriptional regulator [Phycisphaeraceae bacterium]
MGQKTRILIVDDDPIVAESLAEHLTGEGYETATAMNAAEAQALLDGASNFPTPDGRAPLPVHVVLSDVSMPDTSGLELLKWVKENHPTTAVVMLTGYGTIESAVEALRLGASDYLTKPVMDDELRVALERALRQQALMAENNALRRRLDDRFGLDNIVGGDHRMQRVYELIEAVAPSRTTVLMSGESGTGKSLIAHAIHHRSPRATKPYVELSCGSIPETLLESELFGHVKGAFTGAHADKVGRFVAADGGTLFLDEINSASPAMQLKLLRVLQERKLEPVGSTRTIEVDVRVILASNQPLEDLVARGEFRQDLYYRINVVKIELPPLRERIGDIPALADHFLEQQGAELGKMFAGFSAEAIDALRRYAFPGNVRELANIVERAAVLSRGQTIGLQDLPPQVIEGAHAGLMRAASGGGGGEEGERGRMPVPRGDEGEWEPMPLVEALKEPERRIILRALEANGWNRQKTAEALEINRTTLYKKMKAYGLDEGRRAG